MKVSYDQQKRMGLVRENDRHFVASAPAEMTKPPQVGVTLVQPIAPRALLDSHNALINVYRDQWKQTAVSGDIVTNDEHGGRRTGCSSVAELSERRKATREQLLFLSFVNASIVTGVMWLAYLSHWTNSASQTIAVWLILFGALQSWLTWRHIQRQLVLSPEGLEHNRQEGEYSVALHDAQTRRLAIQYAGRAELAKVALQQSQVDAQREAARRLTLETQQRIEEQMQRHTTPQGGLNRLNTYRPRLCPHDAPREAIDVTPIGNDLECAIGLPGARVEAQEVEPITDLVRKQLLDFTADLLLDYTQDDQRHRTYNHINADGQLVNTVVPWSKRGGMTKAQREQAQEILRQVSPWLYRYDETARGWFVNLRHYSRAHAAVDAIDAAYTPC